MVISTAREDRESHIAEMGSMHALHVSVYLKETVPQNMNN